MPVLLLPHFYAVHTLQLTTVKRARLTRSSIHSILLALDIGDGCQQGEYLMNVRGALALPGAVVGNPPLLDTDKLLIHKGTFQEQFFQKNLQF